MLDLFIIMYLCPHAGPGLDHCKPLAWREVHVESVEECVEILKHDAPIFAAQVAKPNIIRAVCTTELPKPKPLQQPSV